MLRVKELKDGSYKYSGVRIVRQPKENFPEMVLIEKAPAGLKDLQSRKFVNLNKAILTIDAMVNLKLIKSGSASVNGELISIGLGSLNWQSE